MKGVEITYLIDPDTRTYAKRIDQVKSQRRQHAQDRPGRPQGPRRQEPRRDLDRHAQPLARPDDHLGLPGGQGRLRREAVQPQRPRRPHRRRGRAEVRPHRPARHPEPHRRRVGRARRGRQVGQATASCWSRAASATSRAAASASSRTPRRPPRSTSTSGSARRPSSRSTPTSSITTGTGSGTSATATSATRASTRWTSPAG